MKLQTCLAWTPVWQFIKDNLSDRQDQFTLLICPFIQVSALKSLLDDLDGAPNLQVITRWRESDIATGVSDIEVYSYLEQKNIPLFVHPNIHLKLFVFSEGPALVTTANVSNSGLGLSPNSNVEVATSCDFSRVDWHHLMTLFSQCTEVTDELYLQAKLFLDKNQIQKTKLPRLSFKPAKPKAFSVLSLPATNSPQEFEKQYYESEKKVDLNSSFAHDLLLFNVPPDLTHDELFDHLLKFVPGLPFINEIVNRIRSEKSASFGLVTTWVHSLCEDKPTPYRKDIKALVGNLYEWLSFCFPEICWDKPKHSMIIYYK